MALTKYKLGDLIEQCDERNDDEKYTIDDVKGISIQKIFIETKANMEEVSLSPYILVKPDYFAYVTVTSRNGEKITLAHNTTNKTYIVSSSYIVFKIKNQKLILSTYLYMYFNRPEFDRFSRFSSWGSARETFNWFDLCDIDIELPSLEIQQKYVNVYNSMLINQQNYERGLEDLKNTFNIFFNQKKEKNLTKISELIQVKNKKNQDMSISIKNLKGINEKYKFVETTANVSEKDINKYLIIENEEYAVNFMCLGNWGKFYLAYNDSGNSYLVSPACSALKIKAIDKLNPYYFLGILQREEFQRKCVFIGDGNTRGGINNNDFTKIKIPLLDKEEQIILAEIFIAHNSRKEINEKLKAQIKDICPILIKGSIEEAKKSKEV